MNLDCYSFNVNSSVEVEWKDDEAIIGNKHYYGQFSLDQNGINVGDMFPRMTLNMDISGGDIVKNVRTVTVDAPVVITSVSHDGSYGSYSSTYYFSSKLDENKLAKWVESVDFARKQQTEFA